MPPKTFKVTSPATGSLGQWMGWKTCHVELCQLRISGSLCKDFENFEIQCLSMFEPSHILMFRGYSESSLGDSQMLDLTADLP